MGGWMDRVLGTRWSGTNQGYFFFSLLYSDGVVDG